MQSRVALLNHAPCHICLLVVKLFLFSEHVVEDVDLSAVEVGQSGRRRQRRHDERALTSLLCGRGGLLASDQRIR